MFRLRDRPVRDFAGIQRNFEQLEGLFAFGSANLFFNVAAISDVLTINHGLGVVPKVVLALAEIPVGSGLVAVGLVAGSATATQFQLQGEDVSGTVLGPGNVPLNWLASGF